MLNNMFFQNKKFTTIKKRIIFKQVLWFIILFLLAIFSLTLIFLFDGTGFNFLILFETYYWMIFIIPLLGFCLGVSSYLIQHLSGNNMSDASVLGIGNINSLSLVIMILITDLGSDDSVNNYLNFLPYVFLISSILYSLLIYFISYKKNKKISKRFIIFGILINFVFVSISLSLSKFLPPGKAAAINKYINGFLTGFYVSDWIFCLVVISILFIWLLAISKQFKIVSIDSVLAKQLGINSDLISLQILIISGALMGIAFILGGNITFLGLVAGNIATTIFKKNIKTGIFASSFCSIIILSLSFFIFGSIIPDLTNYKISLNPVNVISLVSIPYFLYLVFKKG